MNDSSYNPCRCCHTPACTATSFTRRSLLAGAAGAAMFPVLPLGAMQSATRQTPSRKAIKVQPVLVYETPKRVEARSWRNWGGIQTEQDAAEEIGRAHV